VRIIRAEEGVPSANASGETVVCLGFFDGVHTGHAKLIGLAAEIARPHGWRVCVHTFDRMPAQVVRPEFAPRELTPLAEKAALLQSLGVDIMAVSPFDEAMMRMRAGDFVRQILAEKLRAAWVVAGFHHRFGFRNEAGVRELEGFCGRAGIGLSVMEPVKTPEGLLVSSTAIRNLLDAGDVAAAEAMLGRPLTTVSML